jgi:predicted amidophosphoribosyltransferase
MPTVAELSAPYGNFMLGPRPGPSVCELCFDITDGTAARCHRCERNDGWLDAVAPISYSVAHEQLHHVLAAYKREPPAIARRFQLELAAVLWRYLVAHEGCLAAAARTTGFDLVTAVPSGHPERNGGHPLQQMLATLIEPTRSRFEPALRRTDEPAEPRTFCLSKFAAARDLTGRSVLLIDDMWTTGSSARSGAATLKRAGAKTVAALVIGRHLHRDWKTNRAQLKALPRPYDWSSCPHHGR